MNGSWLRFLTSILAVSVLIAPAFSQDCNDGACGICNGIDSGRTCTENYPCCSFHGYCNIGPQWCNSKCQKEYSFGKNCSQPSTPTTTPLPAPPPNNLPPAPAPSTDPSTPTPTTPLPSPPPHNLPPDPAPSTPVKARRLAAAVSASTVLFLGFLGFTWYVLASFGFYSKKRTLTTDVVDYAYLLQPEPIALCKLTKIVLHKWDDMFKLGAALHPETRQPLGIWNNAFENRRTAALVIAIQQTYVQPQFQNNNDVHQVAQEVRVQVEQLLRDNAFSTAVANNIWHLVDNKPPTVLEAICCSASNRQPGAHRRMLPRPPVQPGVLLVESVWCLFEPEESAQFDVVFFSGPQTVWSIRDNIFDCWLTKWLPEALPLARLLMVNYPQHLSLWESAINDAQALKTDDVRLGSRPYFVVGHSIRGVLAKEVLLRTDCTDHELAAKCKGVVFYGVPQMDELPIKSALFRIPKHQMCQFDPNDSLKRYVNFESLKTKFPTYCFIEHKKTTIKGQKMTVSKQSAALGANCSTMVTIPDADHFQVCRPQRKSDLIVVMLVNFIQSQLTSGS